MVPMNVGRKGMSVLALADVGSPCSDDHKVMVHIKVGRVPCWEVKGRKLRSKSFEWMILAV